VLRDDGGQFVLPRLARSALAEFLGTAGLVCAVVGSGIAAQRLSPNDVGLQLLENSIATAFALVALILAFGSVCGAHFNPIVTGVEWARRRLRGSDAAVLVAAQFAGGAVGSLLANAMFKRPILETSAHARTGAPLWLGEVIATVGLLLTIHGTIASSVKAVPFAVASYIGAAYWFTSSTSFANPAVTVARTLSDSFAGIAPSSVPGFVAAQILGAALAFLLIAALLPGWAGRGDSGNPAGVER
jgi:glycerol uptake facilitator-like aquaporin